MIDFWAQLDYLRDVQRNFGGVARLDLVSVFTKILSVVVPVVTVIALWVYRHVFVFAFLRFFSHLISPHSGRIVKNYLVTKGVVVEIYLYTDGNVGRKLADVRVKEVVGGKMRLPPSFGPLIGHFKVESGVRVCASVEAVHRSRCGA